jgi:hypothetical protein
VGIGTSSPNAPLYVSWWNFNTGSVDIVLENRAIWWHIWALESIAQYPWFLPWSFAIWDRTTGINHFVIAWNGNIGIWTTSPTAKLEVAGSIYSSIDNLSEWWQIVLWKQLWYNKNWIIDNYEDRLRFFTSEYTNSLLWTETMSIMANGNVGIWTTSPTAKLDVNWEIKAQKVFSRREIYHVSDNVWTKTMLLTPNWGCSDAYAGVYTIQCWLSAATCMIAASACNSGMDQMPLWLSEQVLCARSVHAVYQLSPVNVEVRGEWNQLKYLWIQADVRNNYPADDMYGWLATDCTITQKP